jgi:excisionase family DNA binding protein
MRSLKNVKQAAELLGISPWTVRAYIQDGKLTPVRIGRRVLLSEEELERFVNESQQPMRPAAINEVTHDNA